MATFHLSKDHLGGHPRKILLCFSKVTTAIKSPVKAPEELSQEDNPCHFIHAQKAAARGGLQKHILEAPHAGIQHRPVETEALCPF